MLLTAILSIPGESDLGAGDAAQSEPNNNYTCRLKALIAHRRRVFSAPSAFFGIVQLSTCAPRVR